MPVWDPIDPAVYYLGGGLTLDNVVCSLDRFPQRVLFAGHFHRWFIAARTGPLDWKVATIRLRDEDRYLVVVNAVCDGMCAVFDTSTSELVPFDFEVTP